jgi:SulP family sulfate permease
LKQTFTEWLKSIRPQRGNLKSDLMSGFSTGLFSVPEGMAYAQLAGVNPVYGLYSGMAATIVASLTTGTVLMISTLTSAIAISTASVLEHAGIEQSAIPAALFTITFLAGATMMLLGLLRLGTLVNYVSNAVMTGFICGASLLIILGELGDLVGYEAGGANRILLLLDWLQHVPEWDPATTAVGAGTITLMVVLKKIPHTEKSAAVIALLLGSIVVNFSGLPTVALVGSIASIPNSLPTPVLPDPSLIPDLALGAIAVAMIALVQGAGIATAMPNPDGSRTSQSRDFIGQGLGNLAGAFFQSMGTGGSLSRTGVSVESGAKSRWSGIFAGAWLALIVLLFGRAAEKVPLAVISGLLCVIGVELIAARLADARLIFRTSAGSAVAMLLTFGSALFIPLQWAIFLGAAFSLLLYIHTSSTRVQLVALRRNSDGRYEEYETPGDLPSSQVTILEHKGNQFFAQVPTMQRLMPDEAGAENAVLVLRMRDWETASSTTLKWLRNFTLKMHESGNRVILEGVEPPVMKVLEKSGLLQIIGEESVFPARAAHQAALDAAVEAAEKWIALRQVSGNRK